MMDAVGIFIPEALAPMDRLEGIHPLEREGCYRGTLGGLGIIQGAEGVFIRGSLPKYLYGQNAWSLTRASYREALGKLETESGLDLKAGRLYVMETAASIPVKESPGAYIGTWGPVPRFQKSVFGNGATVTLANKGRSFSGYDKGKEVAPDGLPRPLEGLQVLRLELRWKKGLKRLYGRVLSPWEASEPEEYLKAIKAWEAFYFRIPKGRDVLMKLDGMTPKGFTATLAALGLQALGLDRADAILRQGMASGELSRVTASRIRADLRKMANDERLTSTAPLTEELDRKVRAVAGSAR